MTANLSPDARSALVNVGTNRQGAKVAGTAQVLGELHSAGCIATGNGLTRKGGIARQRIVSEALNAAF